ncbi:MAG TPA: hypothetical protein P5214_08070 [Rectinema sp.]|nr:hypothetical protein [Rectinema sp.]
MSAAFKDSYSEKMLLRPLKHETLPARAMLSTLSLPSVVDSTLNPQKAVHF